MSNVPPAGPKQNNRDSNLKLNPNLNHKEIKCYFWKPLFIKHPYLNILSDKPHISVMSMILIKVYEQIWLFICTLRPAAARREPPRAAGSERLLGAGQPQQEASLVGRSNSSMTQPMTPTALKQQTECLCLLKRDGFRMILAQVKK